MSSTAGLSRRRVPASASSTGDDDVDNAWGLNGTASSNGGSASRPDPPHSPALHAGSAFEGGRKIAYDPRDLEREDEDARMGGKPPRLTIMEEVLLLGLKDKQVSIPTLCPSSHPLSSLVVSRLSSTRKSRRGQSGQRERRRADARLVRSFTLLVVMLGTAALLNGAREPCGRAGAMSLSLRFAVICAVGGSARFRCSVFSFERLRDIFGLRCQLSPPSAACVGCISRIPSLPSACSLSPYVASETDTSHTELRANSI